MVVRPLRSLTRWVFITFARRIVSRQSRWKNLRTPFLACCLRSPTVTTKFGQRKAWMILVVRRNIRHVDLRVGWSLRRSRRIRVIVPLPNRGWVRCRLVRRSVLVRKSWLLLPKMRLVRKLLPWSRINNPFEQKGASCWFAGELVAPRRCAYGGALLNR